jgi:hypothetical protein
VSRSRKFVQRVYLAFRVYGPLGPEGTWRVWHPKGSGIVLEGWELDEARRIILEAFERAAKEQEDQHGGSDEPGDR